MNKNDVLYKYIQIVEDPRVTEERNKARTSRPAADQRVRPGKEKSEEPPLVLPGKEEPKPAPPPPPPAPEKPKFPEVSGEEMGDYILAYMDGKKEEAFFSKYFCGPVSVEYDGQFFSFPAFLAKVKNMRRVKRISVQLTKDDNNKCVQKMNVKIKRRLI